MVAPMPTVAVGAIMVASGHPCARICSVCACRLRLSPAAGKHCQPSGGVTVERLDDRTAQEMFTVARIGVSKDELLDSEAVATSNAASVSAKPVNAQAFHFVGHARSIQVAGVEMCSSIATYLLTTVFHERSASRS